MKIKLGEKVYLQKYDIAFIVHELNVFPHDFLFEVFRANEVMIIRSPADGYRFACSFDWRENVEWILAQDWLVDYDEYVQLTVSELNQLIDELQAQHDAGVKGFNFKSRKYRDEHFDEFCDECRKKEHRIRSLRLLVDCKEHRTKFTFPSEHPEFVPEEPTSAAKTPRFLNRLFHRA